MMLSIDLSLEIPWDPLPSPALFSNDDQTRIRHDADLRDVALDHAFANHHGAAVMPTEGWSPGNKPAKSKLPTASNY